MYINLYKCVCVGAMKKFTSVSSFCSELRSIATITATMLPVSPFTEFRGVWECVCEQWLHPYTLTHPPHTHTHTDMATHTLAQWHSVCVFNGKHNARKEGKVPAQIALQFCEKTQRSWVKIRRGRFALGNTHKHTNLFTRLPVFKPTPPLSTAFKSSSST